jgi:ribosomal protein L35AE/L33A
MHILQIEHPVPNFEGWKKAFEADPIGRQQGSVLRYKISRKVDDPNYVIIDLEFDKLNEAENFLSSLRKVWGRVEGTVMNNPQARIIEVVEGREYSG